MRCRTAMALLGALAQLLTFRSSGADGEPFRVGGGLEPSFTVTREDDQFHFIARIRNPGPNPLRFFGGMDVVSGPRYMLTEEGEVLFRAYEDSMAAGSKDHRDIPRPNDPGEGRGTIHVYPSWARSQSRIPWESLEHELAPGQALVDTMTCELVGPRQYRFPMKVTATCQFIALSDSIPGIAVLPEELRGETFTVEVDLPNAWTLRE